jgi:single-stranded-DNA-specific exonuclease
MKKYAIRKWHGDTLTEHLLYHRGHTTKIQQEKFLNPDYEKDQHNPFLLKDMNMAVERILKAITENERVVIYSDYDTDGIPGAVVFHDFFKKIGFNNFINYIPHRHDEGFGLHKDAIKEFAKDNTKLIITIDCGITDVESVKVANKLTIDVIITDHHMTGEIVPPAFAIINPKQKECAYPEKMLCGSGVAFKLIQALIQKGNFSLPLGWEKWLLDMVGIATLSDMVPLVGENRVFATYGLKVLRKSPRLGLVMLLKKAKTDQRYLTEDDIGFTIGPRINAASRMGVPKDAFKLLAATDLDEAVLMVDHLDKINNERKGIVAAMVKEARAHIKERYEVLPDVFVLGNPEWKPSLLGLVANTLAQEFVKPVYLWGRDGDGVIKGSCRSDGVTDLVLLMKKTPNTTFLQFGGHAFSGGFSVNGKNIHTLAGVLNTAYVDLKNEKKIQEYSVDAELTLDRIGRETFKAIDLLSPFGMANEKPLFMFRNVTPTTIKLFGKEKNHLELTFTHKLRNISAISFFTTAEDWGIKKDVPLTLIAHIEKSMFRAREEIRLRIVDILYS